MIYMCILDFLVFMYVYDDQVIGGGSLDWEWFANVVVALEVNAEAHGKGPAPGNSTVILGSSIKVYSYCSINLHMQLL